MAIFHLGAIFDASEGKGFTFFATFPWLECLIVLWLSFFFYPCLIIIIFNFLPDPLPPLCHLLSSFGLPPSSPWLDDVFYEQPLNAFACIHSVRARLRLMSTYACTDLHKNLWHFLSIIFGLCLICVWACTDLHRDFCCSLLLLYELKFKIL